MCDLLIGGQLEDLLEGVGQDAGRFDALRRVGEHLPPGPLLVSPNGQLRPFSQMPGAFPLFFFGCDALGPLKLARPSGVEDGRMSDSDVLQGIYGALVYSVDATLQSASLLCAESAVPELSKSIATQLAMRLSHSEVLPRLHGDATPLLERCFAPREGQRPGEHTGQFRSFLSAMWEAHAPIKACGRGR